MDYIIIIPGRIQNDHSITTRGLCRARQFFNQHVLRGDLISVVWCVVDCGVNGYHGDINHRILGLLQVLAIGNYSIGK